MKKVFFYIIKNNKCEKPMKIPSIPKSQDKVQKYAHRIQKEENNKDEISQTFKKKSYDRMQNKQFFEKL